MYEFFEHTADLGLRVRAADLNSLFSDAARGLTSLIVANPESLRGLETRTLQLTDDSLDYLFFDWLSELLYLFETERLLFADFDIRLSATSLTAVCRGEKADPARHDLDHEVKAATYHGLRVEPVEQGWLAEVILDI